MATRVEVPSIVIRWSVYNVAEVSRYPNRQVTSHFFSRVRSLACSDLWCGVVLSEELIKIVKATDSLG